MAAALSFLAALKEYRKFLTLLVVLVGAAAIYFWLEKAKDDRAMLLAQATGVCAEAGVAFQPEGSKQKQWGQACAQQVRALRAYREETERGSADILRATLERQLGKNNADAVLAAIYAKRANEALIRMEAENAKVENDVVGAGYACALNDLGGLRADGC